MKQVCAKVTIWMGYAELWTQAGGGYPSLRQWKRCFHKLLEAESPGTIVGYLMSSTKYDNCRAYHSLS